MKISGRYTVMGADLCNVTEIKVSLKLLPLICELYRIYSIEQVIWPTWSTPGFNCHTSLFLLSFMGRRGFWVGSSRRAKLESRLETQWFSLNQELGEWMESVQRANVRKRVRIKGV